jgi:hypothetical protein
VPSVFVAIVLLSMGTSLAILFTVKLPVPSFAEATVLSSIVTSVTIVFPV